MRPANHHLTDDELDALLGTGAGAIADMRADARTDAHIKAHTKAHTKAHPKARAEERIDPREHLSACEECQILLAKMRALYVELGRLPSAVELSDARLAGQARAIERRISIPAHEIGGRMRTGTRAALLTAAAAILLVAGIGVGRWSAGSERIAPSAGSQFADPVLAVQHSGSAYIAAIVRLDVAAEDNDSLRAVGREVALSTLYGAAAEAARLEPDDPASIGLVDAALSAREGVIASRAAVTGVRSF